MTPQTNDQSEPSLGGRLIRFVIPGPQRQTNRRILMFLPGRDLDHRPEFTMELERRLLGQ